MPRLSCWFVRAALIYLALGFVLGAILLANKALGEWPWAWRLLPLHIEFLLLGWTLQLAMGVAFWILPRLEDGSRGRVGLAWGAWWLLNAGILGKATAALGGGPLWAGGALELVGVALYAVHLWPRIRRVGAAR